METEVEYFDKKILSYRPLKATKNVFATTSSIPFGKNRLFFSPFTKTLGALYSTKFSFKQDFEKYKLGDKTGKTLEILFYDDGTIRANVWKSGIVTTK